MLAGILFDPVTRGRHLAKRVVAGARRVARRVGEFGLMLFGRGVMGFNYAACGYKDVFAFVAGMKAGSIGQLMAFVGYCKGRPGMIAALERKDFAAMAYAYNGKDYGDYDKRFGRAYKHFGGKV